MEANKTMMTVNGMVDGIDETGITTEDEHRLSPATTATGEAVYIFRLQHSFRIDQLTLFNFSFDAITVNR